MGGGSMILFSVAVRGWTAAILVQWSCVLEHSDRRRSCVTVFTVSSRSQGPASHVDEPNERHEKMYLCLFTCSSRESNLVKEHPHLLHAGQQRVVRRRCVECCAAETMW